jgi:hypothetical protein
MQLTQNGIFEDLKHYAATNKKSPSKKNFFIKKIIGHRKIVLFYFFQE